MITFLRRLNSRPPSLLCWVSCAAISAAAPAAAASGPATSALCDAAAARAARASDVPMDVLRAITRTETGRRAGGALAPWPWTVNMEGKGLWFDSRAEALAYAKAEHARGARSFDIGCFQINYRWHGDAFASIEEMFDPAANAAYAARFLSALHGEMGDWSKAAGAYHSRTRTYARKYRARFDRIRAALPAATRADPGGARPRRDIASGAPALAALGPATPGSLVPAGDRGAVIFLGTGRGRPLLPALRARP